MYLIGHTILQDRTMNNTYTILPFRFARFNEEEYLLNKWLDTQDVCQTLNICPRTVQTLRDNGTLAYAQISHKTYYKPEDVMAIVAVVEDKKKDMRFRKHTG